MLFHAFLVHLPADDLQISVSRFSVTLIISLKLFPFTILLACEIDPELDSNFPHTILLIICLRDTAKILHSFWSPPLLYSIFSRSPDSSGDSSPDLQISSNTKEMSSVSSISLFLFVMNRFHLFRITDSLMPLGQSGVACISLYVSFHSL